MSYYFSKDGRIHNSINASEMNQFRSLFLKCQGFRIHLPISVFLDCCDCFWPLWPGSNAVLHMSRIECWWSLMRENKGFFLFAFDSAHVKHGVWTWPLPTHQDGAENRDKFYDPKVFSSQQRTTPVQKRSPSHSWAQSLRTDSGKLVN